MRINSEFRLFLGAAASAGSAGILSLIAAPVLVSALLAGLNVGEGTAGSITSVELITVALVSILIAPKMGVWPLRKLALLGACIAIIGHCSSMFITNIDYLFIARVIAGVGGGLLVASGNASVASAKDPDRIYSLIVLVTGITQLVVVSIGPFFVGRWSYAGGYGMEMIFVIIMLPLLSMLPRRMTSMSQQGMSEKDGVSLPLILALCLMIVLYFSRDSSIWS